MVDESLSRWEAVITALGNDASLKRYAKFAKEPAPLFDSIGVDLASSNQEVREQAYWALVVAMPELTTILYERETRVPGWRDVEGKDQRMINRGADILTDLHRKFVVEQYFKIRGKKGKDPRPLVNRIARNWRKDEQRQLEREVPLDDKGILMIRDPARSPEDYVFENDAYEGWKREFRRFTRSGHELNLLMTVLVDDTHLAEVLQSNGTPYGPAQRQQFSRARKQAVAARDFWFTHLLLWSDEFPLRGKLPQSPDYIYSKAANQYIKPFELYSELVKVSVQPGAWLKHVEKAPDGETIGIARPLTRGLRGAQGGLYLLAVKRYPNIMNVRWHVIRQRQWPECFPVCDTINDLYFVNKLIYPTKDYRRTFCYWPLLAYPTELPGLNKGLTEVPYGYQPWLISYGLGNLMDESVGWCRKR